METTHSSTGKGGKQMKYTKEEILKAAEIGEVSMIDAKHIVSLLDEAKQAVKAGFDCQTCIHSFTNPFDQRYCNKEYDLEKGIDCGGLHYKNRNKKSK